MPLVGLGGYMLSRHGHMEPQEPSTPKLFGEFIKLKISPSCDKISGRLFLNYDTHRCAYDGIKIRLNVHLKPIVTDRVNAPVSENDLFEHSPIETNVPGKCVVFEVVLCDYHIFKTRTYLAGNRLQYCSML